MIKTKLILIEGVPCSGKSSTAVKLQEVISQSGLACQCFLEWSADNPIPIGTADNLPEIISTTKSREKQTLQDWQRFVESVKKQDIVTIIESRFWQTEGMYLYLCGYSEEEIQRSNSRIISIIAELNPVLIYLAPQNLGKMFERVSAIKNKKWRDSGKEGSWEEWGNQVYGQQEWFKIRHLEGKDSLSFFIEWKKIADGLYLEFPFKKIKVDNPELNWTATMSKINNFLFLNAQT
jgi:hypothetical protein